MPDAPSSNAGINEITAPTAEVITMAVAAPDGVDTFHAAEAAGYVAAKAVRARIWPERRSRGQPPSGAPRFDMITAVAIAATKKPTVTIGPGAPTAARIAVPITPPIQVAPTTRAVARYARAPEPPVGALGGGFVLIATR